MSGFDICPRCSAALLPDAARCPRCGATHGEGMAPPARKLKRPATFLVSLLLLAATVDGVAMLTHRQPGNFVVSVTRQIPGVITLVTFDHRNRTLSQGSGFVLTGDGVAASNLHVLKDAARAEATLGDGRAFQVVRVHSFDAHRDLVVFQLGRASGAKVERPRGLRPLTLGASSRLKVGDRIATISSPKGLSNTVSDGLVSAIRDEDGQRMIQMTAPISPGSSGGPVFDASGKVVGIATLQMSQGQNLNFATPIDSLKDLLPKRENLTLGEFDRRAKAAGGDDEAFDRAFDTGMRHQNRSEYRTAVRWYLYAEVLDPEEPSCFYNAGLCYIELREKERAAEQFYRYLATADDDDEDRESIEGWLEDNGYKVPK